MNNYGVNNFQNNSNNNNNFMQGNFINQQNMQNMNVYNQQQQLMYNTPNLYNNINQSYNTYKINDSDMNKTEEILNATIIHECCHWFLHFFFYRLQLMSQAPPASYACRKDTRYYVTNDPISFMEYQAKKLSAYVLIEEENASQVLENYFRGRVRTPNTVWNALNLLAETFKVSRAMARIRMVELGYPEAEGVYCYINGLRVPDHGCAGEWKSGVTYTIGYREAAKLQRESRKLLNLLDSGRYIYVEGHFCLNQKPYVINSTMTQMGRTHVDECCIAFKVFGTVKPYGFSRVAAARLTEVNDQYLPNYRLTEGASDAIKDSENKSLIDDSRLWMEMARAVNKGEEIGRASCRERV